jgi:hypothetical protein
LAQFNNGKVPRGYDSFLKKVDVEGRGSYGIRVFIWFFTSRSGGGSRNE